MTTRSKATLFTNSKDRATIL